MQYEIILDSGLKAKYWEYNPQASQTLIMIHGFRGTHHGMQKIVDYLPKDKFRLVVPDLPGFGESDPFKDGHNVENYVEFLKEFKDFIEPDAKSDILGHSFGSIIVGYYGAKYSDDISHMILVNPIASSPLEGSEKILTGLSSIYYNIGSVLPTRLARVWLSSKIIVKMTSMAMRKTKDKAIRKYIDEQHYAHFSKFYSPNQLLETYNTSVKNYLLAVADKITAPCLIIAGDKDEISPLYQVKKLNERLKSSRLEVIKGYGHLIHYETPDKIASIVSKFV